MDVPPIIYNLVTWTSFVQRYGIISVIEMSFVAREHIECSAEVPAAAVMRRLRYEYCIVCSKAVLPRESQ